MGKIDLRDEDITDIDKIASMVGSPSDSGEKAYSDEIKSIQTEFLKERLEGAKQDRKQRGKFAVAIFGLLCLYMACTMLIVYLNGLKILDLSETVMSIMLGTTTANVIGVFVVVAKYLFHHKNQ